MKIQPNSLDKRIKEKKLTCWYGVTKQLIYF